MRLGSEIVAIVTGGASGLGAATAATLAAAGCKVAIFDISREAGESLARSVGGLFCHCDVTSAESVAAAIDAARGAHGPERILVNCAGIAIAQKTIRRDRQSGEIVTHSLADFERVVSINLVGTFLMASRCAASMATLSPVTADGGR